jgi:hypothetical protein
VNRDGEYFQFVNVLVSGRDLMLCGVDGPPSDAITGALAVSSSHDIRGAIVDGRVPLADPTSAHLVLTASRTVRECINAPEMTLVDGDVVWKFLL